MIIELFGPPGVGKTTFAYALATQLRKRGNAVDLFISYRPTERLPCSDPDGTTPLRHPRAAAIRRLTRPIVEMLTLVRHPVVNSRDIGTATNLIRILPPKNLVWSIRMGQYISRLSHSWHGCADANRILLFDQAYVQAVCSLAILSDSTGEATLIRALDVIPKSDVLIGLDAPRDALTIRLRERSNLQSPMERLFEFDLKRNLKTIAIIHRLQELLRQSGRSVTCVYSLNQHSIHENGERVAEQLSEKFLTPYIGAA